MNSNVLDCLGSNPSQTQENLSTTPFLDCLEYEDFDFDLAQPWSNDFFTWDQPMILPLPEFQDTQQHDLPTPISDLASSAGSDTLVDKSFSEAFSASYVVTMSLFPSPFRLFAFSLIGPPRSSLPIADAHIPNRQPEIAHRSQDDVQLPPGQAAEVVPLPMGGLHAQVDHQARPQSPHRVSPRRQSAQPRVPCGSKLPTTARWVGQERPPGQA